jgi:hypothetical protein
MATRIRARDFWRGLGLAVLALAGLALGLVAEWALHPAPVPGLLLALVSFALYVWLSGKAVLAWWPDVDSLWRKDRHWSAFVVMLPVVAGACPTSAGAQQTIFNVPSADVLDRGKLYLEGDNLWRPSEPRLALFTGRGVVGLGSHVEAGVNLGGFTTPGRSAPTATITVKWQPWRLGPFALTTGAHGLFFLRGAGDGTPSVHVYAHGSYTAPTHTRLTAGAWFASSGYADAATTKGALFGFEQPASSHLNVIADWFTGKNGLGYLTPGISATAGPWTLYAGYSVKNGNSKGSALLIEIGVNP